MVNYQERLGRVFEALVDPTRRAILVQLERRHGVSTSELARPFTILAAGSDEASQRAGVCGDRQAFESRPHGDGAAPAAANA